jgi:hypothetical protein
MTALIDVVEMIDLETVRQTIVDAIGIVTREMRVTAKEIGITTGPEMEKGIEIEM